MIGVDENTTNSFDIGYDAPMIDAGTEDLYWTINSSKFTIQAVSNFDENQIIPIGIVTANEGMSTIRVSGLENIPTSTEIFIHDNETGLDHDIKENAFSIALPIGTYNDRFSLRFSGNTLGTNNQTVTKPLLYFTNNDNTINIKNNSLSNTIKSVSIFNLLGQFIASYKTNDANQLEIKIPVHQMAAGTYIVKVNAEQGNFSEKIIIN